MSYQLSDRLFVALAKKVGYPSYDALLRCRDLQLEWVNTGTPASLFSVALIEGAISPEQVAAFLRWGEQLSNSYAGKATKDERPPLHDTQIVQVEVVVVDDDEPTQAEPPTRAATRAEPPTQAATRAEPPTRAATRRTQDDLILDPPSSDELDLLADSLPAAAPLPEEPRATQLDDGPLFTEDEDEPLFTEDDDELDGDDDELDYLEEDEDSGDLRLLPDDDDADMFALRRIESPKHNKKADTGVMEVLDEHSLNLVDEDEASEVFQIQATWAGDSVHQKSLESAIELGLEEDPLMGVFDSLDAAATSKKRRRSKPESRLGGLVSVFDDDSEPMPALDRDRLYTPEEVLEVIESEDWRAPSGSSSGSGDWRHDDVEDLSLDEVMGPTRSRRRQKVSSGTFRAVKRSGSRASRSRGASRSRASRSRRF